MTPFYVKEFSKENKCKECNAKRAKNRKFCKYHLLMAQERFSWWCIRRKELGKCICCNRKPFETPTGKKELRCRVHKKINQNRCYSWHQKRVEFTRKYGICLECDEGNQVKPGILRCDKCSIREAEYRKTLRLLKRR